MDAQEFRKDFLEDIKADALATGEGSCASFVTTFARHLQEAEYLLDFTSSYFEGTGKQNRKLRVDGYAYDEFDKTMSLIIADYDVSDDERTLTKTQAVQLQNRLIYFIENALNTQLHQNVEMSRSCADLVDILREKRKEIRKYQLLIFTTANISATIKILESADIDGVPSECQIWNIERLFQLCGSDTGRHIIEINFKEHSENGIPCLEASGVSTNDFTSYLCIIPGTMLADIYDKYGSSLLEGNVRSFLSTKVAVNKKIRTTILQQPERFFAYNNGISATAMDVQFECTDQGLFLVSAKDFQIINGGQTTASLSSARYNYKDKANLSVIFVQMKLTVIERTFEDDDATTLVQNISRSSNSQNKVSDADFFSTHPFHVQMERCSHRLGARGTGGLQFETKWFYERARGQYLQKQMRMTPSEKKKFLLQNPKNQLITKTDLAKVRNTWDGLPYIVSKGAQTNFTEFAQKISDAWDKDEGLLFGDKYFQESVALCLIFRYTETMIPRQSWYQQGYRANIVTYTIAFLHKLIKVQFPKKDLDLIGIWTRQTIPVAVQNVLIELSECVYDKLTDPKRIVENVTQWCKREGCWISVQSIEFELPNEIEDCLISQDEMRTVVRDAKVNRRIEIDADIMTRVVEIRSDQWRQAMDFALRKRMVTPEEHTALRIACQLPMKLPTPSQSKKLIALLERLHEEGFKL
ncbi:AIPR family protein [Bacillus sp. FJAT-27445]|uniref:AIPR family protein n=1 Tax=Bacillus sp. FJAT-27445 TaxID=1679166 RepID=UPI000744154D|nr:AIPR family protein [Bacillus sp. FJAT-27445]